MSVLKTMLKRHQKEIAALRAGCHHQRLIHRQDHSGVGRGSCYPREDIVRQDCGKMKIIFRQHNETKRKVKLTLKRQPGFEDQRMTTIQHEYELDPK